MGELRRARSEVAPAPFLVSAILEGLLQTEYREVVYAVPDEADRYCVAAARHACIKEGKHGRGLAIFANDSDLIVFDSGPYTTIIPLNNLINREGHDGKQVLSGAEICPAELSRDWKCDSLVELAWHMSQHTTLSVRECRARMISGRAPTSQEYLEFAAQYQLDTHPLVLERLQKDIDERVSYASMDARVSELVHQAGDADRLGTSDLDLFLPFLTEDPTRTSAWRVGTRDRQLAYEALLYATANNATVLEYKRAAERVSAAKLQGWEFGTLSDRLRERIGLARVQLKDCMQVTNDRLSGWRLFVIRVLLQDFVWEDWTFPPPEEVVAVNTGRACKTWELVHLSAQYQAAFYSLRMLAQIARYVLRTHSEKAEALFLSELVSLLAGLPSLAEFFEPDHGTVQEAESIWMPVIETSMKELNPHWTPPKEVEKKGKGRKSRKRKAGNEATGRGTEKGQQNRSPMANPFAALEAD